MKDKLPNLMHRTLLADIRNNEVKANELIPLGLTRGGKCPIWEIKLPNKKDVRRTAVYYDYAHYINDLAELGFVDIQHSKQQVIELLKKFGKEFTRNVNSDKWYADWIEKNQHTENINNEV